ncbi:LOW QUALITY PROTEIN: tRNA (guanine(37)-N(1))-methyltransferase-like [Ptychodera flava]|uniref:LOW QUALITY PROTEIN: tRNA (guanine(37)-N(1))-methyltransferase-like n=1 Tax=Ptychodera flava TaxID=63121 RepID=UPI00396A8A86
MAVGVLPVCHVLCIIKSRVCSLAVRRLYRTAVVANRFITRVDPVLGRYRIKTSCRVDIVRRFCEKSIASQLSNVDEMFSPPTGITGMKTLDRDAFRRVVTVPALKVEKRCLSKLMKSKDFDSVILKRKRCHVKVIRDIGNEGDEKFLLLDPDKVCAPSSLGDDVIQCLRKNNIEEKLFDYDLEITYKDWTADEILRAAVPPDVEVISSFSRLGHIAHMNLKQEQMEYKNIIGQVILDKNPGIKMVVNKVNTIDNEFRFFEMEVMAGEAETMVVSLKENHCTFEFDFSKVYWNPRLSTEHDRIVGELKKGDVVYDVFAGVGPFAIPAAKKGCQVLANDLNPESHKWLEKNVKRNKMQDRVECFNLDGREFIRTKLKKDLLERHKINTEIKDRAFHVIMNLPALAIDFLDAFPGLFNDISDEVRGEMTLPTIHCHCFSKAEDPCKDVRERIEQVLGSELREPHIHNVRDVAPNKEMLCVTFSLPAEVVISERKNVTKVADGNELEPPAKKQCVEKH